MRPPEIFVLYVDTDYMGPKNPRNVELIESFKEKWKNEYEEKLGPLFILPKSSHLDIIKLEKKKPLTNKEFNFE